MIPQSPLPTRVNRACDRCRRNKSRCDSYRPCSLCLRANAQCENTPTPQTGSRNNVNATSNTRFGQASAGLNAAKRRRLNEAETEQPLPNGNHDTQSLQSSAGPRRQGVQSVDSHADIQDVGGDSTISIARKIHALRNQPAYDYAVHAIPGANDSPLAHSLANTAATSSYLTFPLPDTTEMDELIDEYYDSVHWFSLVVVTAKFRSSYNAIRTGHSAPFEKPFLLLLSTMLGLAAWYRAHRASNLDERARCQELSKRMVLNAESQIVDIMDQRSITAIQTLILLGSYYVYHGRPNLSFSLVGATIKAAQSIGLHKSCPQASHLDREERKRVWWTIYTWDRFSSVNYGRPFGISDKVCNVEQPEDLPESPPAQADVLLDQEHGICYSTYQRELNKLYLIASPAIERVYRTDGDQQLKSTKDYHVLVREVTTNLWQWRRDLPSHLRLVIDEDWPISLPPEDKAHRLQSLSLYLTFDSLILILHRPFMKQRLDSMDPGLPVQHTSPSQSTTSDASSHEQLWNAAVRTTRITELPQLAQHATDGHLINFLMMNMFNAAVVLIVMALSQPLTDRAQQAKRAVARVHRMQSALETRSVLSQQSAAVLRSLIQLLISRESDAILAPNTLSGIRSTPENGHDPVPLDTLTVRDALSMPLYTNFEPDILGVGDGGLDTAARLETGLESVQRAFAGMPNQPFGSHSQSRRQSIAPEDATMQEAAAAQYFQPSVIAEPRPGIEWQNMEPGADTGVHWIWDPAWDNLFDQVEI